MARISNNEIMATLNSINETLVSLNSRIEALEKSSAKTSSKTTSKSTSKKSTTSRAKKSNDFDYDLYLATAKKLAKSGKVRLRENGAPWKADREIVYKAMGIR